MDNEMRKMQQEAVQRVQEMQSRAKQHLKEEPPKSPAEQEEPTAALSPAEPPRTLFDGLMQDSERTLILMLALLLFTEQADPSVIFSLLYLIIE